MSRRIAIVEDDAAIRANYAEALHRQGFEVVAYDNRPDARIGVFRRQRVDSETLEELEEVLIMADLGLPVTTRVLQEVSGRANRRSLRGDNGLRDGVAAKTGGTSE